MRDHRPTSTEDVIAESQFKAPAAQGRGRWDSPGCGAAPGAMARAGFGAAQTFPLSAKDLQPRFQGRALGEALRRAEALWIASDFTLDAGGLLAAL